MASTIKIKNSSTASAVPTSSDLVQGELAINVTDKRMFTENSGGTVVELGTNPSSLTLSGGTANGVAYLNGSKVLTTGSALVFDGTNLGVGTSPSVRLQVYNNINGTPFAWGNATRTGYLYQDASGVGITNASGTGFDEGVYLDTANNATLFYTQSTERARIDSSGNLLVGATSSTPAGNGIKLEPVQDGGALFIGHPSGTSSGTAFFGCYYNGSGIGSISQNGTTGVLYNLTSDYRLKNNPEALTGAKDFVMALQPKKWQWWDGSGEGVGFIAHEFMEVAKYSGNGAKDAVDTEGKPVYQSIQPSSSEVMANLVAHIQDLETRLAALEA
jgi:hypothetical protein